MARYLTDEQIRWCFSCRAKFTEREMVTVEQPATGYSTLACPACGEINVTLGPVQEFDVVVRVRDNRSVPIKTFTVSA